MATVPSVEIKKSRGRGCWRGALVSLLVLSAGCVLLDSEKDNEVPKPPPPGEACQIIATWQNHVTTTTDSAQGGAPLVGVAGRVYLFGKEVDFPMTGDGSLRVDLFDESTGTPVLQEMWLIDPTTLCRLLRRDVLGWGYTVFLPWKNYRPDLMKIRLRCRYEPKKGAALFCESPVTLASENGTLVPSQASLKANGSRQAPVGTNP